MPDPQRRDRVRRWLVSLDLLTVHHGEPPDNSGTLTVLVHSPARDFRDPDVVGRTFRITLTDPATQPYLGAFTAQPAD